MTEAPHPSEIARETLRRLAQRRIPPTPDNYRTLYHEIAGTQAAETFPEKALRNVLSALPRATAEQARFARQMEAATAEKNWEGMKAALADLLNRAGAEPPAWSPLLRDTRATGGFKALVRDVGIARYWRETGNWSDFCRPLGSDDFECS